MHVMLDLETLGTEADCPVLSIGAVVFDPKTGVMGKEFYEVLHLEEQFAMGRKLSADTFRWWMKQNDAARAAIHTPSGAAASATLAMDKFRLWFGGNTFIWSNGAGFDIPIIENLMKQVGVGVPWKFWDARDTRTVGHMAGIRLQKTGTNHNALDDARSQAQWMVDCYKKLGLCSTK